LASRDDWCRPVFLADGPDGALYVCDMYRKTIEHPDYLPEEVRKHTDFESGKDMGRIWRVKSAAPGNTTKAALIRDQSAAIAKAASDEDEVQKLLADPNPRARFDLAVALGDSTAPFAIPALAQIALRGMDDRWTRAAAVSSIAGREPQFLAALF